MGKRYRFSTIKNIKLKHICKIPCKINKIRNFIVMKAIRNTTYGNWIVDYCELISFMSIGDIKRYSKNIEMALWEHPAVIDVEVYDECFDIVLSTLYFDNPWNEQN